MSSTITRSRKNKQAIFTIADAGYAVMALTMFESVSKFYQDSDLFLFVIGTGQVRKLEGNIHVIYIADVLDDLDLSQRLAYYLQVELTTSVRPHCFQYLFAEDYDKAIYLDPDIYVFRRMTEVDDLLNGGVNGVVTPHVLQSSGSANVFGGEHIFLQCGVFNLGFLALRDTSETARMLAWWKEKLKWKCIIDWPNGYFVDQKWLEFLPVFFEGFHILKLPTYNLAPWNSEHYEILADSHGKFFINNFDTPIAFIHYSGVKRSEAHFVHMKDAYRFYCDQLKKRRFMKLDFVDYEVTFKPDNLHLDRVCTCLYKDYINKTKDLKSNPLVDRGFYNYLHSIDDETKLPVYIRKLYEVLPDIFVGYLSTKLAINYDNLIGLMKTNFTYTGVASLRTIVPLRNNSIDADYEVSNGPEGLSPQHSAAAKAEPSYYPAVLSFCGRQRGGGPNANLSDQKVIFKADRIEIVSGPIRVGMPHVDEYGSLPSDWASQAKDYTELWVPSVYCREKFRNEHGLANVTSIPFSVSKPKFEIEPTGLPSNKFIVMLRHDFNLDFAAQNPLASLSAFKAAFGDQDDVLLICFLANVPASKDRESLIAAFANEEHAIIIEGIPDRDLYYSYLHRAHCLISLHAKTAFGYGLAEAMSLGKYVIATKNGGNADFMNSENSFLVDSALNMGDVVEAAKILATIYNENDVMNKKSRQAKLDIQTHLSPQSVGFIMQKRIEELLVLRANLGRSKLSLSSRILRKILRKLNFLLRPRLKKYGLFVGIYMALKKAKGKTSILADDHHAQVDTIMKILLKNVNRPAILE